MTTTDKRCEFCDDVAVCALRMLLVDYVAERIDTLQEVYICATHASPMRAELAAMVLGLAAEGGDAGGPDE